MFSKALILLVLTIAAVHSYVPYDEDQELVLLETYGDSLIDKLKEIVDKAIASAKETLTKLFDDLSNKAKQIVNQAKEALAKELEQMMNQIEKIKAQAKELGIDIVDCLKGREEELKALPQKYGEKIVHCGDEIIEKGKSVIVDAQKAVEGSIDVVKNLTAEFNACGDGWSSVVCKAKVSYEIGKAVAEVPISIYQIASSAAPAITTLVPNLEMCVIQQTQDFLTEGRTIITAISDCVQSKIHPKPEV